MEKRLLAPARVRTVPRQFSWIDQRLLRDGYWERCDSNALVLYLFLVTVADARGLSYYSDRALAAYLKLDLARLEHARSGLIAADLIAYQKPLYQVLSLQPPPPARVGQALSLGALLLPCHGEKTMIDFHTYSHIHSLAEQRLTAAQIAKALQLDPRTVTHWLAVKRFQAQKRPARSSKLDPYKTDIRGWLEQHPFSAQQIFQRLIEAGFSGGYTIVREYVLSIRPKKTKAFLTLSFQPGECAQVDWGQFGSVAVGQTRRRLSFFVMVLCYSRMLYVEFTVSQTMEHFLACHQRAFEALGVPEKIMVDNLKSAVLRRELGEPVLNPTYLDFANHCGFKIKPCNVRKGNEKGRVESAVGYVKKNFLNGLEISDVAVLNPMVRHWLESVANGRVHGETHQRPVDLYAQERDRLKPVPAREYDIGRIYPVRASSRFRIAFETNRYSVPSEFAGSALMLKAYPDRLCIYHQDTLIARHARSYSRHQDFEHPDHPKELLQQRKRARDQKILARFLSLCPQAPAYFHELEQRRFNARLHAHKIIALCDIHGEEATVRALQDAFAYGAFGSDYIANLLEQRAHTPAQLGVLHLTRRQDLLALELAEPDLNDYDIPENFHDEKHPS